MITQWENNILKVTSADFDFVAKMWLFWEHFAKKFKILPRFELFSSYLSLGRSVLGKFFWECRSYWDQTFFLLQKSMKMLSYFHFWGFICKNCQDFAQIRTLFIIAQTRKVRSGQKKIECRCDWDQSFPLAAKHENAFLVPFLRFELFPSLYQRNKRTQKQQIMHFNGLT